MKKTLMKKTPLRRCVGCGQMKDKKELIRITNENGIFTIDDAGKTPGRGAYVCKNAECLEKARRGKGLERSFKASKKGPAAEIYESLQSKLTGGVLFAEKKSIRTCKTTQHWNEGYSGKT
jgi:predicted RNA-binding protein YlxR (DUF448 family)